MPEENLIFIDATGVWEGRERSRSKRAFSLRPPNHRRKLPFHGVVGFKTIKGSMKGEDVKRTGVLD